jgi:hypothetical protein
MIRVYLDWNIISNYKQPYNQELRDFFDKNKKYLLIPYSPAHFTDLMKSYNPDNKLFYEDLKNFDFLVEKHLLRWEGNFMNLLFATPSEYFKFEKDKTDISDDLSIDKIFEDISEVSEELGFDIGKTLKSFYSTIPLDIEFNEVTEPTLKKMFPDLNSDATFWDFMKEWSYFMQKLSTDGDYYKELRSFFGDAGFKVEKNAGNWKEEDVINNIDEFLKGFEVDFNFAEFVELMFKNNKISGSLYDYFTTAYLLLDMIGYKQDKLKKATDNMQNISADAAHAFYAAHCDYFVAGDKNLRKKAKVLYSQYNISTKILAPNELIDELEKVIHNLSTDEDDIIGKGYKFIENTKAIEVHERQSPSGSDLSVFKIPYFYFNFFNYVISSYNEEEQYVFLTFVRRFNHFGRSFFYTEFEVLFDNIINVFGYVGNNLKSIREKFIQGKMEQPIEWTIDGGFIILEIEEEFSRPTLKYYVKIDN